MALYFREITLVKCEEQIEMERLEDHIEVIIIVQERYEKGLAFCINEYREKERNLSDIFRNYKF